MRRLTLALLCTLTLIGAPAQASAGPRPMEVFSEDGTITRVPVDLPEPRLRARLAPTATVTPVEVNGDPANRIDLTFLGDGYTAADQASYSAQVADTWARMTAKEPFRTYRELFNVWQVNVVSPVSGVTGDPTADVVKDTPLGAQFWCDGLERLLCVDIDAARAHAALAPGMDQIAVLANTTKYGGAGYTEEELVTFAGGHALGAEILPHELGHSLGDLADEYPYWAFPGDGSRYEGPELAEANVTIKNAEQMTAERAKWWRWLGSPTPDGGVTGAFEGAYYTQYGAFRPSDNSLMRSLRREFNSVGREKMIAEFFEIARPIDAHTPNTSPVPRQSTLAITTLPVEGLTVRWFKNGHEMADWRGRTSVRAVGGGNGGTFRVEVSHTTPDVRDPAHLAGPLTQSVTWTVKGNH
ncbi:M64 family metallopeptidase [Nonomuraea soli]|uniref:Peptidase M64 n=1 Tax=Nonomuraea soli TaxID=1032476 RepID=A0A7W0CCR3_9ACTN|nr:M64 family metallopeptidase [Nonomuraea soli]MBA2888750.1 hypothetical protein [Nonomuraea soli]